MSIKLEDYLAGLPQAEQAAVRARGAELIAEEAGLRELRKARAQSQEQLAQRLGINQAAVSKIERRTDMYISTLRDLVRALGGELEIVATFPDQSPVRITQFKSLKGEILPSS
jgi:transcriptional regulator with XRE-family HTH domain